LCSLEFGRKLKKKEEVYRDLQEQIHLREKFLNQLAKEEQLLDQTFSKVAKAEYERELSARKDYRVSNTQLLASLNLLWTQAEYEVVSPKMSLHIFFIRRFFIRIVQSCILDFFLRI
jgi:hypothetical protein